MNRHVERDRARAALRRAPLAAVLVLLLGACDDGASAQCEAIEADGCPRFTACDPELLRCVAPNTVPAERLSADPSLAVTRDGDVYLAAYDARDGDLVFGVYDPLEARFRVQPIDTDGDVGREASLALFPDGRPAIAYLDVVSNQLKFTFFNEQGVWQSEAIDPQTRAEGVDLAIDADATPHVTWRDTTSRTLRYARRSQRSWNIENVDFGSDPPERIPEEEACPEEQRRAVGLGVGFGSHITVQGSTPVISYYDADCGALRIARGGADARWKLRVLDGWSRERFALTGPLPEPQTRVGRFNDLAVDALGQLAVVYFDATRGELRAVNLTGVNELVDSGARTAEDSSLVVKHIVGQLPSIAFDPAGHTVVAHLDAATHQVLLSTGDGARWHTEPVDGGPQGFDNDLAIGPDGTRYIVGVNRVRPDGPRIELAVVPSP